MISQEQTTGTWGSATILMRTEEDELTGQVAGGAWNPHEKNSMI